MNFLKDLLYQNEPNNNASDPNQKSNISDSFFSRQINPQRSLLRSSDYFSVYFDKDLNNNRNNQDSILLVKFTGLSNPNLTLLQIYKLLNPYDVILVQWSSNNIGCKFSLQFLYFVRKCFNSYWREQITFKREESEILKNFHQKLPGQLRHKDLYIHWRFEQLLKLSQISNNELDTLTQKKNIEIEHFLLYKLHKTYGIQSKWSKRYEQRLKNINVETFERLYGYEMRINPCLIDPEVMENQIKKAFNNYYLDLESQQFTKFNIFQNNYTPTKAIIELLLQNLQNYSYQTLDKKENIISSFTQKFENSSLLEHQKKYFSDYQKLKKFQFMLTPMWNSEYSMLSAADGLTNLQAVGNEIIFLSQVSQPQLCFGNSPKQFFNKCIPQVQKYYQLFNNLPYPELKNKKYLLPISCNSLIWNPFNQQLHLDKLEVWKLLFELDNHPLSMDMHISSLNMSDRDGKVFRVIKEIVDEQFLILFEGGSYLPIYLAPFISIMIVALRIFHPQEYVKIFKLRENSHKKDENEAQNNQFNLKTYLKQLMRKLQQKLNKSQKLMTPSEQTQQVNHLDNYVNEMALILNSEKFTKFAEQLVKRQVEIINNTVDFYANLSQPVNRHQIDSVDYCLN